MKKKNKEEITIRTWTLFLGIGVNAPYYKFDSTGWDVSSDELCWCIQKQIYEKEGGNKI